MRNWNTASSWIKTELEYKLDKYTKKHSIFPQNGNVNKIKDDEILFGSPSFWLLIIPETQEKITTVITCHTVWIPKEIIKKKTVTAETWNENQL